MSFDRAALIRGASGLIPGRVARPEMNFRSNVLAMTTDRPLP